MSGEVISLRPGVDPSSTQPEAERLISMEYASLMTPDIVRTFSELGVADEFLPIAGRHISDLSLYLSSLAPASKLEVGCWDKSEEKRGMWSRRAVISVPQLAIYEASMAKALAGRRSHDEVTPFAVAQVVNLQGEQMDSGKRPKTLARELALDWLFFEMSVDALANSYCMQQKYNRYISDFNGQSPHYEAELSIAELFIDEYAGADSDVNTHKLLQEEHLRLRSGIALVLLADALVRRGLGNIKQAEWIVQSLRGNYPSTKARFDNIEPLNRYEILSRLSLLTPRKGVTEAYNILAELDI